MESLDRIIYPHAILTVSSKTDYSKIVVLHYDVIFLYLSCFCADLNIQGCKLFIKTYLR